ncbi:MAG: cyclic nucleotide-binding domain-containing protein [Candidatus Omnitrophica bacterium]|nr:cyclic nucleotide-binding domain-containing protein [Candidatus Omnitrophota bacterium]
MGIKDSSLEYRVWAADNVVYGPVELPVLISWAKEGRVTALNWIHVTPGDFWQRANALPELQALFQATAPAPQPPDPSVVAASPPTFSKIKPGMLRRIKILACLSNAQLGRFENFLALQSIRQWEQVVKQGDPGDGMYLVLEGELRVRLLISGKESIIATLAAGEFFGELSLFDHGPRSADVIANSDSLLLKLAAASFQRLTTQEPDLATPFLLAICQTLAARVRADNKRFGDSVRFARTAN